MNVDDFDVPVPEGDMLETIFNHQRELMEKYHDIEEKNVGHRIPSAPSGDWHHAGALDVNDRASQLRMKDFAWRITEELTEATLALQEENETHYLEELIDAVHFSVELLILCGIGPKNLLLPAELDTLKSAFQRSMVITPPTDRILLLPLNHRESALYSYLAIEKLGEAMNRLKLKPWKTTGVITDEKLFRSSMLGFFHQLINLLKASGFTAHTTTAMYLNKNAVNQFRISSLY